MDQELRWALAQPKRVLEPHQYERLCWLGGDPSIFQHARCWQQLGRDVEETQGQRALCTSLASERE